MEIEHEITALKQDLIGTAYDIEHTPHLRAVVRRNAYDFQSHARVEAWTELGWKEVRSRQIKNCAIAAHSYATVTNTDDTWETALAADLDMLLDLGRTFFAQP
jgi:hypothetical protein